MLTPNPSTPNFLTPEQEQFLMEFFALCGRYQQAGVVAYSCGAKEGYEVALQIHLQKKDLDGTGRGVEFGLSRQA